MTPWSFVQLLGSWHLALVVLVDRLDRSDEGGEAVLDESMCAELELVRTNDTMLRLDWSLRDLWLPRGLADLQLQLPAALLGQAGLWALATPLGGWYFTPLLNESSPVIV